MDKMSITDEVCVPKDAMISSSESTMEDTSNSMTTSMPTTTGMTPQQAVSPTVIELFQSQGCSSCPPANDNVIPLANDPDKLVLTYEVTYWDYLGWPDTFGNKAWDERQRDYSAAFKSRSVYTPQVCPFFCLHVPVIVILNGVVPQVIVNGVTYGVGSRQKELQSLIHEGKAAPLASSASVKITDGKVTVTGPENTRGIVQLIVYDPQNHTISIGRGENRGRNLPHRNIVKYLTVLGWWEGGKLEFPLPDMNVGGLKAAIVVQKGRGGPVIAAAKV